FNVVGLEGLESLSDLDEMSMDPEKTPKRDLAALPRLPLRRMLFGMRDASEGNVLGQCTRLEDLTLRHWKEKDLGRLEPLRLKRVRVMGGAIQSLSGLNCERMWHLWMQCCTKLSGISQTAATHVDIEACQKLDF